MKGNIAKGESGFTLIELMISSAIMVLTLLGAIGLLMVSHQLAEESRGRVLALNAARSVLEVVKETPIGGVQAIGTAAYVPAELRNGQIQIQTNPANLTGVTLATVSINVTWNGPRNRPMQLSLSTMRSRY